jgi:hypothetical protein
MIRILISAICISASFNLAAIVYSEDQINTTINNDSVMQSSKEFVRGFFTAQKPIDYVENFTRSQLSNKELLILEHQLYNLLNQVAEQPKQQYLQNFVNQMKVYQTQVFKIGEEGRMQIPVYNIQTRAKGIENIWQAARSVNYYSTRFNYQPITAINALKNQINALSAPRWLGLKNSISNLSLKNQQTLANYFLANIKHIQGLDKYINHFALLTADEKLTTMALINLDKSNSEYILRNMAQYFSVDFTAKMLVMTVNNNKNQAFALSMMSTYVDTHSEIKQLLSNYLSHDKLASNAAFALSYTNSNEILIQLESQYYTSASDNEKKHIIFALQMNQSKQSKTMLKHLIGSEKDTTTKAWLNQFNGESK